MELTTERLLLSPPTATDRDRIVELANDPLIGEMTLNIPYPYVAEDADFWIQMAADGLADGSKYVFAVRNPENRELLGGIGLHVTAPHQRGTIGYWMGAPSRNRGYITEALGALLRFGFGELNLLRIDANHLLKNPASGRPMIKNGMRFEGQLDDYYVKNGHPRSVRQYRILRREFLAGLADRP